MVQESCQVVFPYAQSQTYYCGSYYSSLLCSLDFGLFALRTRRCRQIRSLHHTISTIEASNLRSYPFYFHHWCHYLPIRCQLRRSFLLITFDSLLLRLTIYVATVIAGFFFEHLQAYQCNYRPLHGRQFLGLE